MHVSNFLKTKVQHLITFDLNFSYHGLNHTHGSITSTYIRTSQKN